MLRDLPLRPYALAWVPLAAVYAVLFAATGVTAGDALRGAIVSVLPFALLGLLVFRLPAVLPGHDGRRGGFFAAQLGLAVVFAVAGTASVFALHGLVRYMTTGRADLRFDRFNIAWQVVIGGLIYFVIAGSAYAWWNARRLREEATRAAEADALRARAELAVLRSQLNPHFLLNTLHAALGLVRRDPALAERALERLGEMLHYGLRMHRESLDLVTLADEWAFVHSYLEIESLRLEERLELRLDVDPEVLDDLVPPFVLQPLVENAILHAVAPRKAGGRVTVAARSLDGRLRLEVSDDGPGMPSTPPPTAGGLGLRLLRERLARLYDGNANLSLVSAPEGGLRATIDLPRHRDALPESA